MKHCYWLYFLRRLMAMASGAIVLSGCYDDGTDYISDDVRISLYPSPSGFAADGTTMDGSETYSAVVTINYGASVSDECWRAEILDAPSWVSVSTVSLTTTCPDTWGTGLHEHQEDGIEISVYPNDGARRSFTLRISTLSGKYRDYIFDQEEAH